MAFHDFTNMVFSPDDFAHLKIPLQNILSATDNFAEKNIIGRGGIGNGYKGQLLWSGELIDILALRFNKERGDREQRFWMEVSMLSSLNHKNLVSLLGFCDENDEKITITRREIRGSLDNNLSDSMRLTWVRRLEISVGLANALSYIHYDELRDFSVIHRCIASTAVVLNDNWEPKLYAFDLSMKIKASQRHHSFHTNEVEYVIGYGDPTYIETKSVNHKTDIYSFGVVLFELLFGYRNDRLAPLAITLYREKKLINMIDPELLKQMDLHSFNMFTDIAYECLDNERSRRPNIDDIVPRLEKALELQLKPESYVNNSIVEGTSSSSSSIHKKFQHLKIELQAIKSATNEFDDSHFIGKGGFGKVYKGELIHSKGQSVVALKRLDRAFGQGDPEFWKEIMMLSSYRHDNIVSLLGFCDDCGEKILVYEYASRKSLDLYLNDKDLTWVQRLEICIGVARGLAYLHNPGQTQQRVLHRDIKSSNILLDENWNARIADLGLSKFGPANQLYTFLVSNAVGTVGYCDPLYAETGLLTKESDVYSFGVVLFEVLCGRLCIRNNQDKRQPLTILARKCYEQKTIDDIIFGNIKDEINPHSLEAFTTIAYHCLMREQEQRPLMTMVVNVLESALKAQVSHEPPASSSSPAESDLLNQRMLMADDTPKVGVPIALSEGPWIQDEHGWKTMLRKIMILLPDIFDSKLDVTIGPYETYEDVLFGYKATFEAFIGVRDDKATTQLKLFGDQLQVLEQNLPLDDMYKSKDVISAPIRVIQLVYNSGDVKGPQTVAFNLPNDERIVKDRGSSMVMLKNVSEAKFKLILQPIAELCIIKEQRELVDFDSFFTHTICHECCHGIGPHTITLPSGQSSTVRLELQELHSALEEAKADIVGLWALNFLITKELL